jgi:hypothetical protein
MLFSDGRAIEVEYTCGLDPAAARYLAVRWYDPNAGVAWGDFHNAVVHCVRWKDATPPFKNVLVKPSIQGASTNTAATGPSTPSTSADYIDTDTSWTGSAGWA